MSNFTFAFDAPVTGDKPAGAGNGLPFPKLGHYYVGEITTVAENEYGFICIGLKSDQVDLKDHQNGISFKPTQKNAADIVFDMTNNLIMSNESMEGAVGAKDATISKWANKGLKIGFKFEVQNENAGTKEHPNWVESKWLKISTFTVDTKYAEEWEPKEEWNNAHRKAFWSDGGSSAAPANASTPAPAAGLPVDQELPF